MVKGGRTQLFVEIANKRTNKYIDENELFLKIDIIKGKIELNFRYFVFDGYQLFGMVSLRICPRVDIRRNQKFN